MLVRSIEIGVTPDLWLIFEGDAMPADFQSFSAIGATAVHVVYCNLVRGTVRFGY